MPTVPRARWADRRNQLDIDQSTAADPLGINKRTLQNIETVAGYFVSDRVIYRAARLYHCSAEWLKGETDELGAPPQSARDLREAS